MGGHSCAIQCFIIFCDTCSYVVLSPPLIYPPRDRLQYLGGRSGFRHSCTLLVHSIECTISRLCDCIFFCGLFKQSPGSSSYMAYLAAVPVFKPQAIVQPSALQVLLLFHWLYPLFHRAQYSSKINNTTGHSA